MSGRDIFKPSEISVNGKLQKLDNSKLLKDRYEMYKRSNTDDIWDAYKQPSYRKERAWEACIKDCEEHNGFGLKVVGYNTSVFSAGFKFIDDDKNLVYCHITPTYNKYLLLEQ